MLLIDSRPAVPVRPAPGVGLTPSAPPRFAMPLVPQGAVRPAPSIPQPQRLSLWDRVGPVPNAMRGLLTDDDVRTARTNALLALSGALADAGAPRVGTPAPSFAQALTHGLTAGIAALRGGYTEAAQQNLSA